MKLDKKTIGTPSRKKGMESLFSLINHPAIPHMLFRQLFVLQP